MPGIGHETRRLIPAPARRLGDAGWAVAGALVALVPALWMWGFVVDDALISVRYARHLGSGLGWRFNAGGPSTDGVTPLPWPLLLLPAARADVMVGLLWAKGLGLAAWTATGGALGVAAGRVEGAPPWAKGAALATLALSVPLAAYAVSGMETAVATALATAAALAVRHPLVAAALAGVAASFRPEMAAWACVLAAAAAIASGARVSRVAGAVALAVAPFTACALVRAIAWGHPAPLAVLAKPSDLEHGRDYAVAACAVTLTPILACAPRALRPSPAAIALVVAALAHVAAIVCVGGDWMPYARLMVPVAPSLAYAGVLASAHALPWATFVRSVLALGLGVVLVARGGTGGRSVGRDRAELIAVARPLLSQARRVAALDVGWVGAATDADVVDLAGLTDPQIAALPGGHTSKRVDAMFLLSRDPDALVLYSPRRPPGGDLTRWQDAPFSRVVEARLALDPALARHFEPAAWLPLGANGPGYILLVRTREISARPPDSRGPFPVP